MINPEYLAAAARVAEVQPYPTLLLVQERGVLIEAREGELVCDRLIPWASFESARGPAEASADAFKSVRDAMKLALKEQKAALRKADAA